MEEIPDYLDEGVLIENETNKDKESEDLELEQVDTTLEFDLEKAKNNLNRLKDEDSKAFAQSIINDQEKIIGLEKEIQQLQKKYSSNMNTEYLSIKAGLEAEIFEALKSFNDYKNDYKEKFDKRVGAVNEDFIKRNIYNDFATKIRNSKKKYDYEIKKAEEKNAKQSQARKTQVA